MHAWIFPIVLPIVLIFIMAGYTRCRIRLLNIVRVSSIQFILIDKCSSYSNKTSLLLVTFKGPPAAQKCMDRVKFSSSAAWTRPDQASVEKEFNMFVGTKFYHIAARF